MKTDHNQKPKLSVPLHRIVRFLRFAVHCVCSSVSNGFLVCPSKTPVAVEILSRDGVNRTGEFIEVKEPVFKDEDLIVYERLDDAVMSIDLLYCGRVMQESTDDVVLLFCESVTSMLNVLDHIAIRFGHPTRLNRVANSGDNQSSHTCNGNHKRYVFVTACAVRNVKSFFDRIGYQRNGGRNYQGCVEMTLREFQDVKQLIHSGVLKANDISMPPFDI